VGGSRHRDPSRGQLGPVVSHFLLSHFLTVGAHHPLQEFGENLCVAFEAYIHG
jgi:hypothetical protein